MPFDDAGNFSAHGSPGEGCLFDWPFMDVDALVGWNTEIPDFLDRIEASGDQRSICIMGSLVAEHHVSRILGILLPKLGVLEEQREFTFALQINLIEALHVIPSRITKDLHIVRAVRNEFAHNLSLTSVDELKQSLKDRIKNSFDAFHSQYEAPGSPPPSMKKAMLEMYKSVIHNAIFACRMFEPNLRLFDEVVRSNTFRASLAAEAAQRMNRQTAAGSTGGSQPEQSA